MAGQSHLTVETLAVIHQPLDGQPPSPAPSATSTGLLVETCLRRVWIGAGAVAEPRGHLYRGADGYRFLLEFVTGLHSAVPGETNVLGQFRQAWFRWRAACPAAAASLADVVDCVLRDARWIRSRHLQGIGGTSYGSLVRRLIQPARDARVLIVGAGELSRSLWPFFRQFDTGLWNRSAVPAATGGWLRNFAPGERTAAAAWAEHVILATPADQSNDASWQNALNAAAPRSVTHLGHRNPGRFDVASAGTLYFLQDVFDLRQDQAQVRSLQLEHARAACNQRAGLRFQETDAPLQLVHA